MIQGIRHRVPQDFPTIQSAINASSDGDTVLVAEGSYLENIRYRGKAIVVGSLYLIDGDTTHIEKTIIDGSNPANPDSGSVVSFVNGEDTTSVLCGLTIRGGSGTFFFYDGRWTGVTPLWVREGGGVYCSLSGARIERNLITHNRVIGRVAQGGGVGAVGSKSFVPYLILERNRIQENYVLADSIRAWGYSGGLDLWGASARVFCNVFERDTVESPNTACGGGMALSIFDFDSPLLWGIVRGNIFRANISNATLIGGRGVSVGAGVLLCGTDQMSIAENLFEGNVARAGINWADGGGLCIDDEFSPDCGMKWVTRNRFANNLVHSITGWGGGAGLFLFYTQATVSENEVVQNTATCGPGGNGAGVRIDFSTFRLQGNVISNNSSSGNGAGVSIGNASQSTGEQVLVDNSICNNHASGSGGGLDIWEVTAITLRNNLIRGNFAAQGGGGIILGSNAIIDATVENNVITWNSAASVGGIISWGNGIQTFVNNTIVGNLASTEGGGLTLYNNVDLRFINNIAWDNRSGAGPCQISAYQSVPGHYFNNDIMGGWSQGRDNFSLLPQFVDSSYRLSDISPCIGTGIDSVFIVDRWVHAPRDDFSTLSRPNPPGSFPDVGARENPLPIGINAPALSVSPLSHDFRNVQPGGVSDTFRVAIRNRTLMPLELTAITSRRPEFSTADIPALPLTILAQTNVSVNFLFRPLQAGAAVADTIVVTAGDTVHTMVRIPVCGRGSAPVNPAQCDVAYTLLAAGGELHLHTLDPSSGGIRFVSGFSPRPPPDIHGLTIRGSDQRIYVSHSTPSVTTFYRISTSDGDIECAGTVPLGSVRGIWFTPGDTLILSDSTGRLFGMQSLASLPFRIDSSGIPIYSFARSPTTGQLWGISQYGLYLIDRSTWTMTLVGTFPGVLHPSIAFGRLGTLYGLLDGEFVRFDRVTGTRTPIGSTGVPGLRALVMHPGPVTSEEELTPEIPRSIALRQNYPNPFNPTTTIEFDLPSTRHVELKIYDVLGRLVATLADGEMPAGRYSRMFNATRFASGIYLALFRSGDFTVCRRLLLLR
jgi:hypothetical protein